MSDEAVLKRRERIAQALADAHTKSWGGVSIPLAAHCDADYWRDLASAAMSAVAASEAQEAIA